jgi:hypothetical protein
MKEENTESLYVYSSDKGRVCPLADKWQELWGMLPGRRQVGGSWEPPLPLILGAWNYTSNSEKLLRLNEHIRWADKHGMINEVGAYLRSLPDSDWHHLGD